MLQDLISVIAVISLQMDFASLSFITQVLLQYLQLLFSVRIVCNISI